MIAPHSVDSVLLLSRPESAQWDCIIGAMKPGAHLLLFSNVKEHHARTIAAEDSGLEIRDTLAYVYSLGENDTSIKLIAMARKPLDGTVAENVMKWGVGGLDIDRCRIGADGTDLYFNRSLFQGRYEKKGLTSYGGEADWKHGDNSMPNSAGRWPANLTHDNSPSVVALFPSPHGAGHSRGGGLSKDGGSMFCGNHAGNGMRFGDSGSASRFFYSAPTLNTLATYLLKLVTPINGTVLTLPQNFDAVCKAAKEEGFTTILLND